MKTKISILMMLGMVLSVTSCTKKSSDPEITYYYASGQIRGVNQTFKTSSSFSKFCIIAGVCNTYFADPAVSSKNILAIGFPATAKAGVTYTNDSAHTQIYYFDNTGRKYYSSAYDSLSITLTKWEGHGGSCAGTFSCKLMYEGTAPYTPDSVYIKNGSFAAPIWFVIQ